MKGETGMKAVDPSTLELWRIQI